MTRAVYMIALAVAAALSAPAFSANAGQPRFTTLVLSKFCNSAHGGGYDDGICAGYITGIADSMAAEPEMADKLCLPRDISTSDFSNLVTRYLSLRPELEQQPAAGVVREALLKSFPC